MVIGQRPIVAFGNSDGDQQMLEYTQGGDGARLMLLIHHDDAVREYAYGPESKLELSAMRSWLRPRNAAG
jgi:hypothetical protein